MPRAASMRVDFGGIEELIGNGLGIADAAESSEYIGNLISAAHNVATTEFDVDAASAAAAGTMTHVYEFGTRGITRGTPRFDDPTSPAARLWVHTETGMGRSKTVGFQFREAVVPNPVPSANFYGVPSSVIRKLSRRKYVFRNKAAVNEYGLTVNIRPKDKPFNFVPFYGKPASNPENAGRSYIFFPKENGPMRSTPGAGGHSPALEGTFTNFWKNWWESTGRGLVSGSTNEYYNKDVEAIMVRYPSARHMPEDVLRYNSRGRIYNRRRRVKAKMLKLAAVRGHNRRR